MRKLSWIAGTVGLGSLWWLAPMSCGGRPQLVIGIDASAQGGSSGEGGSAGDSGVILVDGNAPDQGDAADDCVGPRCGTDAGPACGDGIIDPGEKCDDGNTESGDGCTANCDAIEKDFACPVPGQPCVSTVVCGDGRVTGSETCDDSKNRSGDGCDANCHVEPGWVCLVPGARCTAKQCGDGLLAGSEECDDHNNDPGDGCDANCKVEPGWACSGRYGATSDCHKTKCGDGIPEGNEQCDDGNNVVGDGCNPFCEVEPRCQTGPGPCTSVCGDGMLLPGDVEECDDGNTKDGDGCSSTCKVEPGWYCDRITGQLPNTLEVPVTFRDVISLPTNGGVRHPDFEIFAGSNPTLNMVESILGTDAKPVYTGICEQGHIIGPCPYGAMTTSKAAFDRWYNDTPGVNISLVTKLSLVRQGGAYYYPQPPPSTIQLFPLDSAGWVAAGKETTSAGHNFGFTSELRYWFEYKGGEKLDFSGDDDVWVFVNKHLVVDLGGLHPQRSGTVTLDGSNEVQLELAVGKLYETALFHAERHTDQSNFNLTLTGFVSAKSQCKAKCGDGIVAGDEICDDGINDGLYGHCTSDCKRGPYCGDGIVQDQYEQCDDGVNLTPYGLTACAPGCVKPDYCGDGKVDSLFGEQCDDGVNDGSYGKCAPNCVLGPRCGDGVIQADHGEECDDGNRKSGDGCDANCHIDVPR